MAIEIGLKDNLDVVARELGYFGKSLRYKALPTTLNKVGAKARTTGRKELAKAMGRVKLNE